MGTVSTRVRVPTVIEAQSIVRRTSVDMLKVLSDARDNVSDNLPTELTGGMIMGYLRAKGYTWEESFATMNVYLAHATRAPKRHVFQSEMITCSVGCDDYLSVCLERNTRHFDHTIVVTAPQDTASQQRAEQAGASVLVTDRFYRNGNRFDKGGAYNKALELTRHNDWVTFVDVDIVLADDHRARLQKHGLQDDVFYGCDRLNVLGAEERRRFLAKEPCSPLLQSTQEWGYGFYQLFNLKNRFVRLTAERGEPIYPSALDSGYSDHLFRCRFGHGHTQGDDEVWIWDPLYQQKLPWPCYHLGADGVGLPSRTIHY